MSKKKFLNITGIVGALFIWEITAHFLKNNVEFGSTILPTIEDVIISIPKLSAFWGGGMGGTETENTILNALKVILKHSGITLLRVLGGTTLGVILGVSLGILSSVNKRLQRIIALPAEIIRQVPLLVLIPLFLLWFGGREVGIYLYIIFGIFVILFVNTTNAINNVPIIQKQFAMTLGANKFQLYETVIIPAIFPEIAGGFKVSLALAWAVTLGAEYLGAQSGLGRILIMSEYFVYTERMIFILILFVLFSIGLNKVFDKVSERITVWMPSR